MQKVLLQIGKYEHLNRGLCDIRCLVSLLLLKMWLVSYHIMGNVVEGSVRYSNSTTEYSEQLSITIFHIMKNASVCQRQQAGVARNQYSFRCCPTIKNLSN